MFELVLVGAVLLATATFVYARTHRLQLYRDLGRRQQLIQQESTSSGSLRLATVNLPDFAGRLASVSNILPPDLLARIRQEVGRLSATERTYLPTHKKGGAIAYETLCAHAPSIVELYLSPALQHLVATIARVDRVVPTPLHDQSSCSVLVYEKPGDHIGWHYDHNFYKGRHFTVLIPIVNCGADAGGVSAAKLMVKLAGQERTIAAPANTMVLFEGARVLHKVTPIRDGERRVVLSMTYCTDPRNSVLQGIARRIKDTAFFGIRALWT